MRAHTKRTADKQATGAKVCTKAAEHEGRKHSRRTRPTCGKAHAQPPGGTSLHPGAASQTGQTAAEKALHTQAHGGQTGAKIRTKSAGSKTRRPRTRQRSTGRKHAKAPGAKANRPDSGRLRKSGCPGRRRGTPGAEKPLRTGKIRVRSFACPEGPCEPGPPKNRFAVFGWHGLFASHF